MGLIQELPLAPDGKSGWPWTRESQDFSASIDEGREWPRISIVTPSYNQGRFLEETIRSVLLQNYPNLEYIVMDGGSTDQSIEIIKRYEDWIDYWVSEDDGGQSKAINTGIQRASGEIVNWMNSDDCLVEGALRRVANAYRTSPEAVAWVGACNFTHEDGEIYQVAAPVVGTRSAFANWGGPDSDPNCSAWVGQPSCFFSRSAFLQVGGLNPDLHFTMDVELWMKLIESGNFCVLDSTISSARVYPGIKTRQDYPARMAEHVIVNWLLDEKPQSRVKMVEFGERYLRDRLLSMGFTELSGLLAVWIYRKLLKDPFAGFKAMLNLK